MPSSGTPAKLTTQTSLSPIYLLMRVMALSTSEALLLPCQSWVVDSEAELVPHGAWTCVFPLNSRHHMRVWDETQIIEPKDQTRLLDGNLRHKANAQLSHGLCSFFRGTTALAVVLAEPALCICWFHVHPSRALHGPRPGPWCSVGLLDFTNETVARADWGCILLEFCSKGLTRLHLVSLDIRRMWVHVQPKHTDKSLCWLGLQYVVKPSFMAELCAHHFQIGLGLWADPLQDGYFSSLFLVLLFPTSLFSFS